MNLETYGDLAVRVALNLQPGQRLLIIGPLVNGGVSIEAAALVRAVAASAYRAGAELVEPLWGDEPVLLARFEHARRDTLTAYSRWMASALVDHVKGGGAVLSIYANDPDLLAKYPPELVGGLQQAVSREVVPFRQLISRETACCSPPTSSGGYFASRSGSLA